MSSRFDQIGIVIFDHSEHERTEDTASSEQLKTIIGNNKTKKTKTKKQ